MDKKKMIIAVMVGVAVLTTVGEIIHSKTHWMVYHCNCKTVAAPNGGCIPTPEEGLLCPSSFRGYTQCDECTRHLLSFPMLWVAVTIEVTLLCVVLDTRSNEKYHIKIPGWRKAIVYTVLTVVVGAIMYGLLSLAVDVLKIPVDYLSPLYMLLAD